jgi:HEAT repeat protein
MITSSVDGRIIDQRARGIPHPVPRDFAWFRRNRYIFRARNGSLSTAGPRDPVRSPGQGVFNVVPRSIDPAVVLLVLLLPAVAVAQPASPSGVAEELIERERLRATVQETYEEVLVPVEEANEQVEFFVESALRLAALGPDVVPYVVNELEQQAPRTFFFSAYVLGHIGGPAAEAALRREIERADEQWGRYAQTRKAWAAYALGLMGVAEAVDLLTAGKHSIPGYPMHADTSVLEATALLTSPASAPRLTSQLERFAGLEEKKVERSFVVKALGRLGDPAVVPAVVESLQGETVEVIRRDAALALRATPLEATQAPLVAALEDPSPRVRAAAALALEALQPENGVQIALGALENESSANVRGPLYRLLAEQGGVEQLPALVGFWGRPDSMDRFYLVGALAPLRAEGAFETLKAALHDGASRVMVRACAALGTLGTPEALALLTSEIDAQDWVRAQSVIETILEIDHTDAAPRIAARLVDHELAGVVDDPRSRGRIELLLRALVELRYTGPVEALAAATERQVDAMLVRLLNGPLEQLRLIKENGDDVDRWLAAARSEDEAARLLAYERLAEIGDPRAAAPLAARFGRTEPDEGVQLLRALASLDSPASRELIRRVLTSPAFDGVRYLSLREMAAWAATRYGGDDMTALLRQAVERQEGRDAKVLIYLALLDGRGALPVLERWRIPRMRYLRWGRGLEQEKLDWLARELRAGRPLDSVDQPPERLNL